MSALFPLLFFFGPSSAALSNSAQPLQEVHTFKVPKFVEGGTDEYIGKNVAILDVDYWKDPNAATEKIFVTTPRGKPGTPATLSTIVKQSDESLLSPYPSWEANKPTCDGMISTFRTEVDVCNRLWAIDCGVNNIFTAENERICPPKIWIYDVITDTLINKYELPEDVLKKETLVTTIVVDVRDNKCDEAFAYIADPVTFRLIVFSLKEEKFWFFSNRLLYPYPLSGEFTINGVSFDLMDGVLGLALGPAIKGDRTLYLHSLASRRESTVATSVLRNPDLGGESSAAAQHFKVSYGERSSQSAAEAIWEGGLYFDLLGDNYLACWPLSSSFGRNSIKKLYKNETSIQFVSGMKAISGNLWILSSTFQTYIKDQLNENIINYRVIKASISKLTRGRGCHR